MNKEEYNNGGIINISDLSKEEKHVAISQWAEGNKYLEKLLTTCNDNGLETIASCAGHNKFDVPYVTIKITNDNVDKILHIMDRLNNVVGVKNEFAISKDFSSKEGKIFSMLGVYTNMKNRDKIFKLLEKTVLAPQKGKISTLTEKLWQTHNSIKESTKYIEDKKDDEYTKFHYISYENGVLNKKINISSYNKNENLTNILKKLGFEENPTLRDSLFKNGSKSTICNTLDDINGALEKLDKEKIAEEKGKSNFKEALKEDVNTDIILEVERNFEKLVNSKEKYVGYKE